MKRLFLLVTLLLVLVCPAFAGAAEISSDRMILVWTTSKVWINSGCIQSIGIYGTKGQWIW